MKKHLHTYSFDGIETMNCQVWLPEMIEGALPAILFLHGSGERGADESLLAFQALPKYLAAGRELPAAVICPGISRYGQESRLCCGIRNKRKTLCNIYKNIPHLLR